MNIRERLGLADKDADELQDMLDTWALDADELEAVNDELESLQS